MKIIKFGGTSVGEAHAIKQICYILNEKKNEENRYAIVVSAIGGITDKLIKCAHYAEKKNEKYYLILDEIEIKHLEIIQELFTTLHKKSLISRIIKYINNLEFFYESIYTITYFSRKSLDKIMNFGELISSYLINEKLKESGFHSIWKDSRELIVTENKDKSAQVNFTKSFFKIKDFFIKDKTPYVILPGFIASTSLTETTTLGRGGSDYSASIFSAAIQAELLEIWTDVSGIMTAHPKIVSKAFPVEKISYREAIELSNFGAKVIYPPTIIPSMNNNIPILIRNTFSPLEKGTIMFDSIKDINIVTGITGMQNITSLNLESKLGMIGYSRQFFTESKNFHVFIKQSNSELCLEKQIASTHLSRDKELCIIAVIINDMKNISVTSGHMFSALGKKNINIQIIGSTEKNIYAVIANKFFKKSMKTLHEVFFEKPYQKIHLFIAGLGQVGNKLIEQLNKQKEFLFEELHLQIKVIGICNSKKMYFNTQGINLNNLQKNLNLGLSLTVEKFIYKIYSLNLCNSLFVDSTASKEIANHYDDILGKGIGVITCNKIACASSYQEYKKIKNISRYFKTPLFFETNVGAGLPVINTLNYLVQSGDKIHFIDAVLSGSLNFIFNKIKGSFTEIVREAKNRGYTEPDPRIDLSGIDVIRKILILIRECGFLIELEDIKQVPLLPKNCIKSSTKDSFYQKLLSNEDFFIQRHIVAKEQRKRIRFIARYKCGETFVGIKYIEFKHPFYHLEGKDNIILYTTDRYVDQPLLVKGAGAGAEVTASGVFSDIIKTSI